jgi:Xaa-Pro aminopeptidase
MYGWPAFDAAQLRRDRWGRTAELMAGLGLDHLLLTTFDVIRFATDYRTLIIAEGFDWFAAIVGRDGDCEIFVPWVDEVLEDPDPLLPWVRALHPLPSWTPALPHRGFWVGALAEVLRARGAHRVGMDALDGALLEGLRAALPEVSLTSVATELYDLRLRKDPVEVELLAAASAVNSRAAEAALAAARPGALDHDVLAAAMASLQRAGVEYLSHSLCNVRRGSGTWFAVGNELREGEAFFFDIGCYGAGGYASDMARVGFVGEPPAALRVAHRRLLEAHRVGEEMARPGVRASEIQAAVNGYLERQGMPITPYSVGHGIGLRACELPTIHRADRMDRDQRLAEGMVIALEPETAVEIDGRLVVLKVEDDYVVEADGLRRLTDAPYATD